MSFAVVHMQKFSRGGLRGIQSHNQREKTSRSNPDIDYERSSENHDLHNQDRVNYNRKVSEIIEKGRTNSTRAVRKDAVVMCNFVVTSDKDFFDHLGADQREQFFKDAYKWFADRYGMGNVVNATVHMDEKTPHLHIGVVPITKDGRLSAKDLFNRQEMTAIQTEFPRDVGEKYGLQRGVEGSERTHLSETRFKAATLAVENEKVLEDIELLKNKKDSLQSEIEALKIKLKDFKAVFQMAQDIDAIGRTTLMGKVSMSKDDALNLKKQAKAYYLAKSDANRAKDNLVKIQKYYAELENEVPKLREKVRNLSKERDSVADERDKIKDVLQSSPALVNAFNAQLAILRKVERGIAEKEKNKHMDYER